MLSWRISSLVKRKEAWRRAFNWLSQDCSVAGSLCPPPLRPGMLVSYGAGYNAFQRAYLHDLASTAVQAVPSLKSVNESATLSDEAKPGLETAVKENAWVRLGVGGEFVVEDGLRKIVNNLIFGSRYRNGNRVRVAMADLRDYQGQMDYPTLHSVMEEFRMQPGSSQIAGDFMNLMASKGVVMEEGSYKCFLLRLCQENKILRAFEVLTDLGKAADEDARGVVPKPSIPLVNIVLAAARRLNYREVFYKTLDFMKQRNLQPQGSTYLEIIKMAGQKRKLPELREVWAAAGADFPLHVPIPLHTARIVSLSRLGSLTEALVAFEEMKEAMRFYGRDSEGQQSDEKKGVWLNHPGSLPSEEESPEASKDGQVRLINGMCQVAGLVWDASSNLKVVYTSLMSAAASEGNTTAFLTLSKEMEDLGMKAFSNEVFFNMLLRTAASAGGLSEAKKVAWSMKERGIAIETHSYRIWVEACCKSGNLDAAESLLVEALSKNSAHIDAFRALIHACLRKNDWRRGRRLADMMRGAKLEPSQAYYAALIMLVGSAGTQTSVEVVKGRLQAVLMEKKTKQLMHSCSSFHALVWTLGSLGSISDVMDQFLWVRDLRQHPINPLLSFLIYNTAIHACLRLGKMAEFSRLMQMLEEDYAILESSARQALMRDESYGNSTLKSAMKVLDALPTIGREPNLATFNFLIKVVCHDDDLNAGVRLLHLMVAQGVERDKNTYMHLLTCAARLGDLKQLSKLVDDMHREGFSGDVDTCLLVTAAHVRRGSHANAVRLLKALVDRMRKTPAALASGSEALFEQLEKWIAKDRERYIAKRAKAKAANHENKEKGQILDVENTAQKDQDRDVEKTAQKKTVLDMEKEEDSKRRILL